ncbi:MAG: MBL fold metallo-hydrolase [Methanomassiliicoccales archaeon]|nr:MAG: MBL fold metallo-hydrolase [Methanomassiliicoccales archaeon]
MANITMYGGVGEIGGNKVLLEEGKTRIFLDMGQSFGFGEEYFTGFLGARDRFGLRDYFELNLVPKIPGLYSKETLEGTGYRYRKPMFDGIFLSHIHFDHTWHLRFVHPDIPVCLGEGTKIIMDSWVTTSKDFFGEHDFQTFRTGDRIKLDGIEVEPIHVDHSVPAAYGYIIHTKKGTIVYTGDFRKHGSHSELTEDFLARVKEERPIALICEGTRVASEEKRKNYTEAEVKSHSKAVVRKAGKKLVVTTFYPRDVDRMRTFYEVAKATGRKFVVSAKTAHLLTALGKDPGIKLPDVIRNKHLLVYVRELKRYPSWEKDFEKKAVNAEYVHKNQDKLILQLDFFHFNELVDIQPKKGSHFIHSKSEPFVEDDIEEEVKNNWLDRFGLKQHQLHASGHCSMEEIKTIVKDIDPKVLIPIHCEEPELFKSMAKKVILPILGKGFEV